MSFRKSHERSSRAARWIQPLSLVLLLSTTPAVAQSVNSELMQGPVEILADSATSVDGVQILSGHVRIESRSLRMTGDRVALTQFANGQLAATITGAPAHIEHLGTAGEPGPLGPAMSAQADKLSYHSATGIVELSGNVMLSRGNDRLSGAQMTYSLLDRSISASSDPRSGPVRLLIQTPQALAQELGAALPAAPAPDAPTAPATQDESTP